jgi:hypothetical protein
MPLTLIIRSAGEDVRKHHEALAQRVVASLGLQSPARRLLVLLDDEDWQAFKAENGIANRGFYARIRPGHPHWRIAPRYILDSVFVGGAPAYDDFVYLHGTTCADDIALTMTLAHELQHFIQHADKTPLWAANGLVPNLDKTAIAALGLRWCDIPHEREARIVSKRIAEDLFGPDAVRQHVDARIASPVTEQDGIDWKCIRELAVSTPYDLAHETKLFFPRLKDYSGQLQAALAHFQASDPDFADVNLPALLDSSAG